MKGSVTWALDFPITSLCCGGPCDSGLIGTNKNKLQEAPNIYI